MTTDAPLQGVCCAYRCHFGSSAEQSVDLTQLAQSLAFVPFQHVRFAPAQSVAAGISAPVRMQPMAALAYTAVMRAVRVDKDEQQLMACSGSQQQQQQQQQQLPLQT